MFSTTEKSISSFLQGMDGELSPNEPMGKHTRWNLGGKAQYYFPPNNKTEVVQLMCQLPSNVPVFWLGAGRSVMVRDGGLRGVAVSTQGGLDRIKRLSKHNLYVQSGVASASLAQYCRQQELAGLEFLKATPGSIGAAIAMSHLQVKKWKNIKRLECVNRDGDLIWCGLNQLKDVLHLDAVASQENTQQAWIVGIEFRMSKRGDDKRASAQTIPDRGSAVIDGLIRKVRSQFASVPVTHTGLYKQSVEIDPTNLLREAGLAGHRIGAAGFDNENPNELNVGRTCRVADVEQLVDYGRETVHQKLGIDLHSQLTFVGQR